MAGWRSNSLAAGVLAFVAVASVTVVLVVADPGPALAFPAPGTETAAAGAELSFRGVAPGAVEAIEVVGAGSGEHPGTVVAHSDGRGASFRPAEPFAAGESVTIRTGFEVHGVEGDSYRITITPDTVLPDLPAAPAPDTGTGASNAPQPQVFTTRPDLRPPAFDLGVNRTPVDDEPLLLAVHALFGPPDQVPPRRGVYVMSDDGDLVWGRHVEEPVFNLHRVTYDGRPALTWWQGEFARGFGFGEWVVVDERYEELARLDSVGYPSDPHEVLLSTRGGMDTAIFLIYQPVERDLTDIGGARDGVLLENVIQEVDLATGAVVFEWHSLDHIPAEETVEEVPPDVVDYLHVNSIDVAPSGDLLLSARNTSALYLVARDTGDVLWRLGGRRSDFALDEDGAFDLQHDARWLEDDSVSLFDNGDEERASSRVLTVSLDGETMRARVLEDRHRAPPVFGRFSGNAQTLPEGNRFVSWGSTGAFTEYSGGRVVLDGTLVGDNVYRMTRAPWRGTPSEPPDVVAEPRGQDGLSIHASWNGAGDVGSWRVDAVRAGGRTTLGTQAKDGFETIVELAPDCDADHHLVVALDARGDELASSRLESVPGC